MMGEEFLLRWNDYQSSFSTMIESICLTQEMTDCTIAVGEKTFSAHRMVLSTCSPYFRSLFATVPPHLHPVVFLKDVEVVIVELLLRYMYSGQVSVVGDRLVPLVQAAKSLRIKGLLDVPVPATATPATSPAQNSTGSQFAQLNRAGTPAPPQQEQSQPTSVKKPKMIRPKMSSRGAVDHQQRRKDPLAVVGTCEESVVMAAAATTIRNGPVENAPEYPVIAVEDDNSMEDDEEGVDPIADDNQSSTNIQSQLLRRLTNEMTAYPFTDGGGGEAESPHLLVYSCEHCGKEFTSKRKHQRHVLNVHFGYNPVLCPFCQKGHRDNYNLKQHVCPVLNMKYGQFQKKEKVAKARALKKDPAHGLEARLARN